MSEKISLDSSDLSFKNALLAKLKKLMIKRKPYLLHEGVSNLI